MAQFLKIEKNGNIINSKLTNINELYKKCGFRKSEGFEKIINWKCSIDNIDINIELWGKTIGKGNIKNNYIFPIPIDKTLYGNCGLINYSKDILTDLNEELWNKVCNKLNEINTCVDNSISESIKITNDSFNKSDGESEDCESDDSEIFNEKEMEDDYDIDSELKEESYIYSSEEEDL